MATATGSPAASYTFKVIAIVSNHCLRPNLQSYRVRCYHLHILSCSYTSCLRVFRSS